MSALTGLVAQAVLSQVVVSQAAGAHTSAAQLVAAFVLHAVWQAPLLAGAAALAIRIGRPQARMAHALWAATLLLCVLMPVGATVTAQRAAREAERNAAVSVTYAGVDYTGPLPEMQRAPVWERLLARHFNLRDGVRPFSLALSARVARVVAGVYLFIALCLALRLMVGWRRSRRLVLRAAELSPESEVGRALLRQCAALGLAAPAVRMSDDVAGPALAGAFRPTLLLPSCSEQMSHGEIEAVLAHELAHLRRHDPPVHLACSLLLVPVGFHPAALWVAKRVRQTREMACDAEAAAQMGSATRYAHALLQVAERTGMGDVGAAGVGLFQSGLGLFDSGLGLFSNSHERTGGAMEERMRTMMTVDASTSAAARAARWSACVLVGGVALLAAAMVQVQPALAQPQQATREPLVIGEEQTVVAERAGGAEQTAAAKEHAAPQAAPLDERTGQPRLLGGARAQQQLRKARRDLDAAAEKATTDEERGRIEIARAVIGAAQQQLAAASGPNGFVDVETLRKLKINPQVHVMINDLKIDDLKIEALKMKDFQIDPQVKILIEKQRVNAERIRAEVEKHRAEFDRIRIDTQSPEFQAKIRAHVDAATKQMAEMKIDQVQMQRMLKDADQQREHSLIVLRSGEMQRQIAAASAAVARVEVPDLPGAPTNGVMRVPDAPSEPSAQSKPIKIEGRVMAGNVLNNTVPVYPQEAKDAKISGSVVLHALIDETGKVESLQIISSPDKSLSVSATDAVQHWTYRPYLLNGNPTAVETTITVNYTLAS